MRGIEQDRDYFKAECELLENMLHDARVLRARPCSPAGHAVQGGARVSRERVRATSPKKGPREEGDSGVELTPAKMDRLAEMKTVRATCASTFFAI